MLHSFRIKPTIRKTKLMLIMRTHTPVIMRMGLMLKEVMP